MHISLILDPDACIYDVRIFSGPTDGRTNERTNKAILGVGCNVLECNRIQADAMHNATEIIGVDMQQDTALPITLC